MDLVDDKTAVDGTPANDKDPNEGKETDFKGIIVEGRGRKQKRHGGPKGSEDSAQDKVDQAGLHEKRFSEIHVDNTPHHAEIVESTWVFGRVIWQEQKKKSKDAVLRRDGVPVNVAPGSVICNDAREESGNEHAEGEACNDEREACCAAVRRGEIADEGQHELGGYGCHAAYKGDAGKGGEVWCEAEGEPLLFGLGR